MVEVHDRAADLFISLVGEVGELCGRCLGLEHDQWQETLEKIMENNEDLRKYVADNLRGAYASVEEMAGAWLANPEWKKRSGLGDLERGGRGYLEVDQEAMKAASDLQSLFDLAGKTSKDYWKEGRRPAKGFPFTMFQNLRLFIYFVVMVWWWIRSTHEEGKGKRGGKGALAGAVAPARV